MFGTFEVTPDAAKFKMRYWGVASYLQTGCECVESSHGGGCKQAPQMCTVIGGGGISSVDFRLIVDSVYWPSEAPGFGDPDSHSVFWPL